MALRIPFSAKNSKELFEKIRAGIPDPLPEGHPYSEDLVNAVNWALTIDVATRPSAREMLDSQLLKGIREGLMDDTEFIESYKEPNLKLPIFLPSDRKKLNRRILAKIDPSYKYVPEKK